MAKFEDLAVRYMDGLVSDFSLPPFQAAAIVGNGGAESGGFTKIQEESPRIKGSAGGLGHFQWTGRTKKNPRRANFEALLASNADKGWTPRTFEANYAMLVGELRGSERAALAALRKTDTIEDATTVFCRKFERAGIEHMESRIRWARRALKAYDTRDAGGEVAKPDNRVTDRKVIQLQQEALSRLGYPCGGADGAIGPLTKSAIRDFRADNKLPAGDYIDDEMIIAIQKADKRKLAPERENASPSDVREKAPEVAANWRTKVAAWWTAALSAVGAVGKGAMEYFDTAKEYLAPVQEYVTDVPGWIWLVALCGVAAWLARNAAHGEKEGVEAFRAGQRQ